MTKLALKPPGASAAIDVTIVRADAKDRDVFEVLASGHQTDVELERSGTNGGWLRVHGRIIPFRAFRREQTLHVWMRGRCHTLEIVDRSARRVRAEGPAQLHLELTAPMPGSILQVNVKPGDVFEAHAPLVVMVSMKMEMTLTVPHAGKVKEVRCQPGQLVEIGAVLMRFEEIEP